MPSVGKPGNVRAGLPWECPTLYASASAPYAPEAASTWPELHSSTRSKSSDSILLQCWAAFPPRAGAQSVSRALQAVTVGHATASICLQGEGLQRCDASKVRL
jgi:hypothetical protein